MYEEKKEHGKAWVGCQGRLSGEVVSELGFKR